VLPGPDYLSRDEIIELHNRALSLFGGMTGIRDGQQLDSCVAQPRTFVFGHERFEDLFEKAAAYAFNIIRLHPFFDGNKRTGLLAAMHFLLKNSIQPEFNEDEMFRLITAIASGQGEISDLAALLRKTSIPAQS
jgi:death-on-curing protein